VGVPYLEFFAAQLGRGLSHYINSAFYGRDMQKLVLEYADMSSYSEGDKQNLENKYR
jgi:hypothetical protein